MIWWSTHPLGDWKVRVLNPGRGNINFSINFQLYFASKVLVTRTAEESRPMSTAFGWQPLNQRPRPRPMSTITVLDGNLGIEPQVEKWKRVEVGEEHSLYQEK